MRLRSRRLAAAIQDQVDFYAPERTASQIAAWQLETFNSLWQRIVSDSRYWGEQNRSGRMPGQFSSWQEFSQLISPMDRSLLQRRGGDLFLGEQPPDAWRSTGGTTAQPVRIPVWRSEIAPSRANLWYGRSWLGIEPSDRLFLLWGHSHLLGRGWRGRLRGWLRKSSDTMLGYLRWSAYDLSEEALRQAGQALLDFKPRYVLGYSVALDRLARSNLDRRGDFHRLGLKAAIATAESFPHLTSAELVSDCLGCPVAMEYGAVETGPVAHQDPQGGYHVFWRNFFLEALPHSSLEGAHELFLTTLYPRCLPLIRYRIGDLVTRPDKRWPVTSFQSVLGRCNDTLQLEDGKWVHSEAFTHAVKESDLMEAFQVSQKAGGRIQLLYLAPRELSPLEEREIRARFQRIHPALSSIELVRSPQLQQSMAGKTGRILREPD